VEGRIEGAKEALRSPFTFDHARPTSSRAAPVLDQHTSEIRAALARRPDQWPERTSELAAEPA